MRENETIAPAGSRGGGADDRAAAMSADPLRAKENQVLDDPADGDEVAGAAIRAIQRSRFVWRTTDGLAAELGVEPSSMYLALCAESARSARRVRYHPYPSARTLDVLWSTIEKVGDDPEPPPLTRDDAPIESPEPFDPLVPNVFVSHNHHDAVAASDLAQRLSLAGVRPWLYTSGIDQDAPIIHSVRQVLHQCWGLVAVVTADSLGSLWVKKEFALPLVEAASDVDRVLAVIDSDNQDVVNLLGDRRRANDVHALDSLFTRSKVGDLMDRHDWRRRAEGFLASLDEFIERGGAIAFHPGEPERIPARLRVTTGETWAASVLKSGPPPNR